MARELAVDRPASWEGFETGHANLLPMSFVRALDDLAPFDLPRIGGKARSCATLRRARFDVPEGFVVHCEADAVPEAAIREAVSALGEGPLAVRSSALDEDGARHSFAGVHRTLLNVAPSAVVESVRACLASMTGPEADAYRRSRGLEGAAAAQTVLVQRMVEARIAGVGFTSDPVRPQGDEMVIAASWGSGEAVVGGRVEPDEIRVHRPTRGIVSQFVGSKAYRIVTNGRGQQRVPTSGDEQSRLCLDAGQIATLTDLLLHVEAHFGETQDVEWCHDGDRFWILQSRPITAAVREEAAHEGIEWSRTNVREVLPDLPSPQSLDFLVRLINSAMRGFFGPLLGPEELGPMIRAIGGRPYFNLTRFRRLARASLIPPGIFMKAMGHADGIRPEDMSLKLPPLGEFLRGLPTLGRVVADQVLLRGKVKQLAMFAKTWVHEIKKVPMEDRSDEQLIALMEDFFDSAQAPLRSAFTSGSMIQWQLVLEMICQRVGFPYERLVNSQLAVGEKTVSSQQAFDLLRVAHIGRGDERVRAYFETQAEEDPDFRLWGRVLRGSLFKRELHAFLDDYGHRGTHESDWSLPRYSEDPTPILFAVARLVTGPDTPRPEQIEARLRAEADTVWREFRAAVPSTWRELLLPFVRWVIGLMKGMYVVREQTRFEMVRGLEPLREVGRVMAGRMVARRWIDREEDYFMLTVDEIAEAVRSRERAAGLRAMVAERRASQERWNRLDMPLYLRDADVDAVLGGATGPAVDADATHRLLGLCTSPGRVEAEVIVMRDANEFARMRPGAIIVAPATDPSWTPLFTLAAGVVVEIGGTLSHASTIAREYGLPALANVKDATRLLRDGERVRLDATAGWIERIR
jgi:pyruvate,water dikinase